MKAAFKMPVTFKLPVKRISKSHFLKIMTLTACLIGCFGTSLSAHQGASGIVKERMDEFSKARGQMKQMQRALQNNQFEAIADISADMQIWAQNMVKSFPEGSDVKPSEASLSIWRDSAGFANAAAFYNDSLIKLNELALTYDREAVITAYQAVGQACKSCHERYRQR